MTHKNKEYEIGQTYNFKDEKGNVAPYKFGKSTLIALKEGMLSPVDEKIALTGKYKEKAIAQEREAKAKEAKQAERRSKAVSSKDDTNKK